MYLLIELVHKLFTQFIASENTDGKHSNVVITGFLLGFNEIGEGKIGGRVAVVFFNLYGVGGVRFVG